MHLVRLIIAVLLGIAAAGATAAPTGYHVMRHLQKGAGEDPGLSDEGRRGAERLATWFGAEPPTAIYVSTTRRARETAAPLAARLGLVAKEYDPRDTPSLVARASAESGRVLIVGHSNTVPEIIAALGGERPEPIAETDFGAIWKIGRDGSTSVKMLAD